MAHSCPECGLNCHCGGDIDDCEFEGTIEQMRCRHCEGKDDNDDCDPGGEQQGAEPVNEKKP